MTQSREIHLTSRPVGMPNADNFEVATIDLAQPGAGEVQVRNQWMTVDPYMRGRMNDVKSYTPPFQIGQAMEGGAVGQVIASNDPSLQVGDLVQSNYGWREAFNAPAGAVQKLPNANMPPQAYLGVAGMPGLTAYVGLLKVAALKDGDVVFVSGAAGAVGSLVVQIAKAKGNKVVASAGGAEKVAFVRSLGADAVIDYKAQKDLNVALAAAAPDGIDVYFDNVGGDHLEAALTAGRPFARLALCGAISMYNSTALPPGPSNLVMMVGKQMRMEGFIVSTHWNLMEQFQSDLAGWVREGKVTWKETVHEGIDKAPEAFLGLFKGENLGKMLVKLS